MLKKLIMNTLQFSLVALLNTPTLLSMKVDITTDIIRTSLSLPLWKIQESNTLHKFYLTQKTCPNVNALIPPSICSQELNLFRMALHKKSGNDFNSWFYSLTPANQHMLITAAGKKGANGTKKLNAKGLTCQLIDACFPKDVVQRIKPACAEPVISYLRYQTIILNAPNFPQQTINYKDSQTTLILDDGAFYCVPSCIEKNGKGLFDGEKIVLKRANEPSLIFKRKQNKDKEIVYEITATAPQTIEMYNSQPNSLLLWMRDTHGSRVICTKEISLKDKAIEYIFSPDGRYLAIGSEGTDDNLLLIKLATDKKNPLFSDILLTGHSGKISQLCFNHTSTMLVSGSRGSNNNLIVWNTDNGTIATVLKGHKDYVNIIQFNHDETKLLTCSTNNAPNYSGIVILYDMSTYESIAYLECDSCWFHSAACSPMGDTIAAITNDEKVFLLSQHNGKSIMEMLERTSPTVDAALVFSPDGKFFITGTVIRGQEPIDTQCSTNLWDAVAGKKIASLLTIGKELTSLAKKQCIVTGIGFTPDMRSVVSVLLDDTMITTELFDDTATQSFAWVQTTATMFQTYLLYRSCKQ